MNKKHKTLHHMLPQSRGGPTEDWNLKTISNEQHVAFHKLFGNMTSREIVALLRSKQFQFDLDNGRWEAWCLLFGRHCSPEEAAEKVIDEWTPNYPKTWKGSR